MSNAYAAIPAELASPWNERGKFAFDEDLLLRLIKVQDDGGDSKANTGALVLAVDIWIATELRRAAIAPDIIWPRPTRPRALSQSLSSATDRFKYARKSTTREVQEATISKLGELAGSSSPRSLVASLRRRSTW